MSRKPARWSTIDTVAMIIYVGLIVAIVALAYVLLGTS